MRLCHSLQISFFDHCLIENFGWSQERSFNSHNDVWMAQLQASFLIPMQCSFLKWLVEICTEWITFTKSKLRLWRYLHLRLKGKTYLFYVFIHSASKLKKSACILRYQRFNDLKVKKEKSHLITSSIRPQMFQLGGCVIRTVTVVCCIAVCGTICWLSCTRPLDVVCCVRCNDIAHSILEVHDDVSIW